MADLMRISLTGDEYNAIIMALSVIGGRAFGASAAHDGVDPVAVAMNAAEQALRVVGPVGVMRLVQRMGAAADAAFGSAAMTENISFRSADDR